MIWDRHFIDEADFKSEEEFLKSKCLEDKNKARATLLLAELYCKRARKYNEMASPLARRAPESKDAHNAIFDAEGGAYLGWNAANHGDTIGFYKEFIVRHPNNRSAYLWLLDLLVADCRCAEARECLDKMNTLGRIRCKEGDRKAALETFAKMTDEYPNLAETWFVRENESARLCRYDEAIEFFEKYTELAKHPQFADAR